MRITSIYKNHSSREFNVKTPIGVDFSSVDGLDPCYFVVSQGITRSETQYLENRCHKQYVEETIHSDHTYFETDH